MRKQIIVNGATQYIAEREKIFQMIESRMKQIAKSNPDMTYIEANLQAIVQLMENEELPLIRNI